MSIVNQYSSMHLSHETDRSYALQGIISAIEQSQKVKFVAGVCEDFFPYSLLWFIRDAYHEKPPRTPLDPATSSWSCSFRKKQSDGYEFACEPVLHTGSCCANLKISTTNSSVLHIKGKSFGPLLISAQSIRAVHSLDGTSAICARLCRGSYRKLIPCEPRDEIVKFKVDGEYPRDEIVIFEVDGEYPRARREERDVFSLDFRLEDQINVHLVLLTVDDEGWGKGLILEKVESSDDDLWERAGTFVIDDVTNFDDSGTTWFDVEREFNVR